MKVILTKLNAQGIEIERSDKRRKPVLGDILVDRVEDAHQKTFE